MSGVAFDTLSFVKIIESSGLSRAQAEAIASAVASVRVDANGFATREDVLQHEKDIALIQRDIAEIKNTMATTMATKSDLALVKRDISEMKEIMATKSDIELVKRDLTIRLGSMIMALGGILIAVKFLS
jgi:hypothetical protein